MINVKTHVNERCRRKEERSKQGHTSDKAKQHNTPKAVTFLKKNKVPRVGFESTTHSTCIHLNGNVPEGVDVVLALVHHVVQLVGVVAKVAGIVLQLILHVHVHIHVYT